MAFDKVFKDLIERKKRAEEGKYNSLPLPFPRYRNLFPGIEQGRFFIITANQKIGKSKLSDFLFVYEPIFFAVENPNFHFKVIYFTLEMSAEAKELEFYSHLLYRLDNLIVAPTDLRSVDNEHPVPQNILDLLQTERYQKYIKFYEEKVEYFRDSRNPTGLRKVVRNYADMHGKYNHIPYESINDITGQKETKYRLDPDKPYTPDDPDEYVFVITDNAANIATEKGMTQKEAIEKWSKDCIDFRDDLKYIPILIQHQAQSQESVENMKLDAIIPSTTGLGVAKTTGNDASIVMGLYNPFKYGKRDYEGYDLTRLKQFVRFMIIIEDRDYGAAGNICPLFFNGASSYFTELPKSDDKQAMNAVYSYIESLEKKRIEKTFFLRLLNFFKRNKQWQKF